MVPAMTVGPPLDADGMQPEVANKVAEQLFELWVFPELTRRGLVAHQSSVVKAVVILKVDESPEVMLDNECLINVHFKPTPGVAAGERITLTNIADIPWMEPANLHPDAAWIAYLRLADGREFIGFRFLYQRGRARRIVALAEQYLDAAGHALSSATMVRLSRVHWQRPSCRSWPRWVSTRHRRIQRTSTSPAACG